MKKIIFTLLIAAAVQVLNVFASERDALLKEQVKSWMNSNGISFEENKGQMTDMEHKTAPYLLFKAQGKGVDMYITEWGLSYVFIKAEEVHHGSPEGQPQVATESQKENAMPFAEREENKKIEYCRADMELKGASIKKENIVYLMNLSLQKFLMCQIPIGRKVGLANLFSIGI
jgi:hypothetical protein